MDVPPHKKSKMEAASSGVIIIDPTGFPSKHVAPPKPREQYLLPPHNKNFTSKTTPTATVSNVRILPPEGSQSRNLKDPETIPTKSTQSVPTKKVNLETLKPATTVVRIMPKWANKISTPQAPLLDNAQNRNLKVSSVVFNKNEEPGHLLLSKHPGLVIKSVKSGAETLSPQPYKQPAHVTMKSGGGMPLQKPATRPNEQLVKSGVDTLIKDPTMLPNQSSQGMTQLSHSIKSLKQSNLTDKTTTTAPENLKPGMQYIEFINEALFDNEEQAKNEVLSVTDSDDNDDASGIEEKALEYMLQIRKTHSAVKDGNEKEYVTQGVQTDQADADRIYCGFVNVTKNGKDKYFNLRCFYCEAEYPISFYAEFSEHITETHRDLEKLYAQPAASKPDSEFDPVREPSSEFNFSNDSDSSDDIKNENLPPGKNLFSDLVDNGNRDTEIKIQKKKDSSTYVKQLLPEDFDDGDGTDSASETENIYLSVEKYDPNLDHSYSQNSFNKDIKMKLMSDEEQVDEITFIKTSREIVMDFLEHLRGFQSLWRDRSLATVSYDNELLDLMDILIEKWGLNLKRARLRKNLENIKAWYIGMTVSREELGEKFYEHKYIEYYNKCAEYLPCGDTSKLQKVICDVCDRFCYDAIGLQVHKYRKHRIGQLPYGCNRCSKRFDLSHKLRNHLRTHYVKRTVPQYVATVISERPKPVGYTCAECDEKFDICDEFKKHLEIHPKGDCPYICSECGDRFKSNNTRNAHQLRHQEPTYSCELCPKKFYVSYHLKHHMDGHKGVKNFICELCGKMFQRKGKFNEHIQYAHSGRGICKICNRNYNKLSILSKHLRTMHRPLIGTIEELSKLHRKRGPHTKSNRKGKGTGPRLATRKYEYIIDPVTQKRRIACPKCDKSYNQYDSLYMHYKRVHGSTIQDNRRCTIKNDNLSKARRKRQRGKSTNKSPTDTEETAAVNSIAENAIDPLNTSDASTYADTPNNSTVEVQIKNENKISTTLSFEKFVDEIAISNNYALQSPNSIPPLGGEYQQMTTGSGVKSEEFIVGDYDYILNSSSVVHFS